MEHIDRPACTPATPPARCRPYSLSAKLQDELRRQTTLMARALNVVGLMNVQFAIQGRATTPSSMCSK